MLTIKEKCLKSLDHCHRLGMKSGFVFRYKNCTENPTVAQTVKNLPAVQETWIQSLGQENSNHFRKERIVA